MSAFASQIILSAKSPRCRRLGARSAASTPRTVLVPPEPSDGTPTGESPSGAARSESPYDRDDASPFQPDRAKPLVKRVFPITETLPHYRQRSLQRDLIAGVTVAALALPSGMA